MRKIRKRKTNQKLIYGIVFSALLFLTIGYSVLTTSLNFNITAHKTVTYEIGDQIEVVGLSPTFHVVEVHDDYLKLLSDSAVGTTYNTTPSTVFENTMVYYNLVALTSNWKSSIERAGGYANYYNITLISKEELTNLILMKNPGATFPPTGDYIGWDWIADYDYKFTYSGSPYYTRGFYTRSLESNGAFSWNFFFNHTTKKGFFGIVTIGANSYGMDIRPYLTIDIESVRKL